MSTSAGSTLASIDVAFDGPAPPAAPLPVEPPEKFGSCPKIGLSRLPGLPVSSNLGNWNPDLVGAGVAGFQTRWPKPTPIASAAASAPTPTAFPTRCRGGVGGAARPARASSPAHALPTLLSDGAAYGNATPPGLVSASRAGSWAPGPSGCSSNWSVMSLPRRRRSPLHGRTGASVRGPPPACAIWRSTQGPGSPRRPHRVRSSLALVPCPYRGGLR